MKKLLVALTIAFTLGLGVFAAGSFQTSQLEAGLIQPDYDPGPGW